MRISKIFDKVKGKKIIIVGDAMIDSYTLGRIERESPEAPVPIINVEKEKIKEESFLQQLSSLSKKLSGLSEI